MKKLLLALLLASCSFSFDCGTWSWSPDLAPPDVHRLSVLFDTTLDLPIDATALPLVSADLRYFGYSGRTPGNLYDCVYGAVQAPQATGRSSVALSRAVGGMRAGRQ